VGGRIFGARAIERAIRCQKPDYSKDAGNSLAGVPHENNREKARAARRLARQEKKRDGD